MTGFAEQAISGLAYAYQAEQVVSERSAYQQIEVYEHPAFGRMLVLDGLVQTTERDEFVYHEMLAHVPLISHPNPRRVLVVGGGDGGTLRRALEHPTVERVVMVEIDERVTEVCRREMPSIGGAAFDDPRADVRFDDGIAYVRDATDTFDVVLVDSSDPVGPGEGLFTPAFYAEVRARLEPGGVVVAQSGSPYFQQGEMHRAHACVRTAFADTRPYIACIPTYPGVLWSFTMGSDGVVVDSATAARAARDRGLRTRYWTPAVHEAAFALPQVVLDVIAPEGPPYLWGRSPEDADATRGLSRG